MRGRDITDLLLVGSQMGPAPRTHHSSRRVVRQTISESCGNGTTPSRECHCDTVAATAGLPGPALAPGASGGCDSWMRADPGGPPARSVTRDRGSDTSGL